MSRYNHVEALYIAVSEDKYELPIAVAENEEELCRILGLKNGTIRTHIYRARKGIIKKQKYFRVEIDNE